MNQDIMMYLLYQMFQKKQLEKAQPDYKLDNLRDQATEEQLTQSKDDQLKAKLKKEYIQTVMKAREDIRPVPRLLDPVE